MSTTGVSSLASTKTNRDLETSFCLNDTVRTARGHIGVVKFIGEMSNRTGIWYGLLLNQENGKNNGTIQKRRYFKCSRSRGAIFIRKHQIQSRLRIGSHNGRFMIGDHVSVLNYGFGIVRFCGETMFGSSFWFGVELEMACGKNNGIVKNVKYFSAEMNHGIFARATKLRLVSPINVDEFMVVEGRDTPQRSPTTSEKSLTSPMRPLINLRLPSPTSPSNLSAMTPVSPLEPPIARPGRINPSNALVNCEMSVFYSRLVGVPVDLVFAHWRPFQFEERFASEIRDVTMKIREAMKKFSRVVTLRFCGGCVRDAILGESLKTTSIDMTTDTLTGEEFAKELQEVLGEDLSVHAWSPIAGYYGANFTLDDFEFEVCTLRDLLFDAEQHQPGEAYGSIEHDALNRDLTINAIFYNVNTGKLEDPTNGWQDLVDGVARTPHEDPRFKYELNPLCVVRHIRQIVTQFGFEFDEKLFDVMKRQHQPLRRQYLDEERCFGSHRDQLSYEVDKLLNGKNLSVAFEIFLKLNLMDIIFPLPFYYDDNFWVSGTPSPCEERFRLGISLCRTFETERVFVDLLSSKDLVMRKSVFLALFTFPFRGLECDDAFLEEFEGKEEEISDVVLFWMTDDVCGCVDLEVRENVAWYQVTMRQFLRCGPTAVFEEEDGVENIKDVCFAMACCLKMTRRPEQRMEALEMFSEYLNDSL